MIEPAPAPLERLLTGDADPPAGRGRRWWPWRAVSAAVAAGGWLWLASLVGLWATVRWVPERWWPVTLLLLGPRWWAAIPLAVLGPAAVAFRRRSLGTLALGTAVVAGPVVGLCLPWRRAVPAGAAAGPAVRVFTCNLHARAADPRRLAAAVAATRPDVVALEEWDGLPDPTLGLPADWHWATRGQLRVGSRWPLHLVADVLPTTPDGWSDGNALRADLDTPAGPVPVFVLHLASPHFAIRDTLRRLPGATAALEANGRLRREQAATVGRAAAAAGPRAVCLGDCNLPSDAEAFRRGLTDAGLSDAFGDGGGLGPGWTYRVPWTDTRIDHVLTGPAWRCRHCWVGPDVGSPHRPILADLEPVGRP